ncbi:hypothetical protein BBP40_000430 [Aspergillus hancockii]|nr:hypothetical protein BBP40_000430 [Aspergillus hancockii]
MPNTKAPLHVLSDDNHGPLITLVSVPFLITAFVFVAAQWGSVIYFKQRRPTVNTPIWMALVVLMQKAIEHGVGRHVHTLTTAALHLSGKYNYAAQLLQVIILSLSKLSTTILLWNLTFNKAIRLACIITVGLTTCWTIFACFGIAFLCKLPTPWLYTPDKCAGTILYPISILHILIELAIIVIPFFMMRNVQLPSGKRIKILCSFLARLLVVGLAIAQLAVLSPFLNSTDPTWTIVKPTICGQAMMCVTVTIACLPILYHIFAGFHSGLSTTRPPDEVELMRNTYKSQSGRKTRDNEKGKKRDIYTDTSRFSNMASSVIIDISSAGGNGDIVGRSSTSESTESMRHLTRASTREGVLKTVDITVEVQEEPRR